MDGWFLFVDQDKGENNQVHHNAKYHYFTDDTSLCGKYIINTDLFETNIESGQILLMPNMSCKKCYKKWIKEMNIS